MDTLLQFLRLVGRRGRFERRAGADFEHFCRLRVGMATPTAATSGRTRFLGAYFTQPRCIINNTSQCIRRYNRSGRTYKDLKAVKLASSELWRPHGNSVSFWMSPYSLAYDSAYSLSTFFLYNWSIIHTGR